MHSATAVLSMDERHDPDAREELIARARKELRFSAVAFHVMGCFGVLGGIFYSAIGVWCAIETGWFGLVPVGLGLGMICPAIWLVVAGRHMLRVRRHGLCLAVTGLAATPLNLAVWPISLPFAVVAFVVLTRPHVKRAFLLNDPDHDPDAG